MQQSVQRNQGKPGNQYVNGQLHLGFAYHLIDQETRLIVYEQQPPLKVIRAFPLVAGGALVHLHNVSGGVLAGDQLALTVEVERAAYAQLTSTSATRIYRSKQSDQEIAAAEQTNHFMVGEGGLLEYLPDPLIPFAGSRYRQRTRIELASDAGLFYWETITPGRVARGELFQYSMLQLGLEIKAQGKPVAIERFQLEPQRNSCSSLIRLGSYHYFSSFYICRVGLEAARWLALEKQLSELAQQLTTPGEISWGVSSLVAHGLVIRVLSRNGREVYPGLLAFWQAAKMALYGREANPPRKIY